MLEHDGKAEVGKALQEEQSKTLHNIDVVVQAGKPVFNQCPLYDT